MKKRIYSMILILMTGLCAGCGKEGVKNNNTGIESESSQVEDSVSFENTEDTESTESTEDTESTENTEYNDVVLNEETETDFTYDYSEDIKADVDNVVSGSASLQDELENIENIIKKYTTLAQAARTQIEMNLSSRWFFDIWDTELNNLWSRFSDLADPQTKEKILAEQRNWIAMKEEVTLLDIGSSEENGSMYPLLWNADQEEITKNRAYVIANELAKIKGESFVMPERSAKYGLFVDNQGTGSVYSSLITRQSLEGEDEALISIYREGETKGTFVDNGNGEMAFTSDDGSVKGTIKINGWDGASFKVTETSGEAVFSAGEEVNFPFAF